MSRPLSSSSKGRGCERRTPRLFLLKPRHPKTISPFTRPTLPPNRSPYYGGPQGFETVLDLLDDACTGLLAHIQATEGKAAGAGAGAGAGARE